MSIIFRRRNAFILGLIFVMAITTSKVLFAYEQRVHPYPHNLDQALNYYGFKTQKQKEALRYLLQAAGIENVDALLDTQRANANDLSRAILNFVRTVQVNFTIRTGSQERWDVQTSAWMQDKTQQAKILDALKTLDMLDAIPPKFLQPDAICILGASRSIMVSRLDYASNLYSQSNLPTTWLIMLAGERYVTPDKNGVYVDGSEEFLNEVSVKLNKNISSITETDLMRLAYESSKLYAKFGANTLLIDAPRRDLPRHNTEGTVTELCMWLKNHPEVQKLTFVSNQPHVEYQKAIIKQVLIKNDINVKFEVVGPEYYTPVVHNTAHKINYIMQGLGSKIWAMTPEIINSIGLDMSDPQLDAEYKELYKKQPVFYNGLSDKHTKKTP